ncbi:UNVERIFIED_CONTAM: hypothetical protein Sangu_0074100 [Sesamum angustifolium]|uniref:Uncharacterized protein n=1 Tax=Sesamum angustifolium TaxID=2727405 RepID=A0AAW2RJ23_9LAMI
MHVHGKHATYVERTIPLLENTAEAWEMRNVAENPNIRFFNGSHASLRTARAGFYRGEEVGVGF